MKTLLPRLYKGICKLKRTILRQRVSLATEVVKTNTKEAFEFFFAQDDFLRKQYLDSKRLDFYEVIGDYSISLLYEVVCGNDDKFRIIDVGCGMGNLLWVINRKISQIPKFNNNIELVGLDFARTAIDKAKNLLPRATFLVEDIYENTLPSNRFDLVLCIETLEHLHEVEKSILQLLRICKPQGKVVIAVPNGEIDKWDGHVNFWSLPQLQELLLPYGLIDIRFIQESVNVLAILAKEK